MSDGVEPLPIADAMPTSTNTGSTHSFYKRQEGTRTPDIASKTASRYHTCDHQCLHFIQRKINQIILFYKKYGRRITTQ